jgi:hypothetical protein
MAASLINTDFIRQHLTQAVLTVSGLSGVVLIFLPFMYDDVPVEYFLEWLPGALGSDTHWGPTRGSGCSPRVSSCPS